MTINAADLSSAPGGPSPAGLVSNIPQNKPRLRAAVYIDGFNLYHAIRELKQPYLRWLNLWELSRALIHPTRDQLEKVMWCTAEITWDHQKQKRHRDYRKALEAVGVTCALGHFIQEPVKDLKGNVLFQKDTEKEGDIHVALHLILDGMANLYDIAYLVSADSDLAATVKIFRGKLASKGKKLISVAPPGRIHSQHVLSYADGSIQIKQSVIEACLFQRQVTQKGRFVVSRPSFYDPPPGWKRPPPVR